MIDTMLARLTVWLFERVKRIQNAMEDMYDTTAGDEED